MATCGDLRTKRPFAAAADASTGGAGLPGGSARRPAWGRAPSGESGATGACNAEGGRLAEHRHGVDETPGALFRFVGVDPVHAFERPNPGACPPTPAWWRFGGRTRVTPPPAGHRLHQLPAQQDPRPPVEGQQVVQERRSAPPLTRDVDHGRDGDLGDLRMPAEHIENPEAAGNVPYGQRSEEAAAEVAQVGLAEVFRPGGQRTEEPVVAEIVEASGRSLLAIQRGSPPPRSDLGRFP